MKFKTYFVLKQEILIRRFAAYKQGARVESFRATLTALDSNRFELTLLNSDPEIQFSADEFLELHSDRFDLGVRLTGICLDFKDNSLRLEANDDLEIFYRRKYWRITVPVWSGLVRAGQSRTPLSEVWEKAQILQEENNLDPSIHVEIVRRSLNLSAGGVRMSLQSPIHTKENCLLYLCLDDGQPTVCALCEVVWVEPEESDLIRQCGLRFCNILENDLKRIDHYVVNHCRFDSSGNDDSIEHSPPF